MGTYNRKITGPSKPLLVSGHFSLMHLDEGIIVREGGRPFHYVSPETCEDTGLRRFTMKAKIGAGDYKVTVTNYQLKSGDQWQGDAMIEEIVAEDEAIVAEDDGVDEAQLG